ncbi:MAG TPA: mechanosensitive ion channel [Desulfobacteraceae bacterium]|nr:mechanosensitive ion channel [Desulfobacteraceae bacterium]
MNYLHLTSPCGLDCFNCPMYLAKNDEALRSKIAQNLGIPKDAAWCKGCREHGGTIPYNEIMKRDIINHTTITKEIRVRIPIGITYEADVNKGKEGITNVAYELDWVMRNPPMKVVVKSFGESSVNLEARVWISDPRRRIDTISHVTHRVKKVFEEQGIQIPYPKRDIIRRETREKANIQ